MARECPIAGKSIGRGNKVARRGIAVAKGGIGLNILGRSKRTFSPNLQKKRVFNPATGLWKTIALSTAAIRTVDKLGFEVTKPTFKKSVVAHSPKKELTPRMKKKAEKKGAAKKAVAPKKKKAPAKKSST